MTMKKTFFTLMLFAHALGFAQLTNSVKVSALPGATTPLAGTEIVPLVQSGVTKTATIGQICAAPTAANLASSNSLFSLSATISNALANLNSIEVSNRTAAVSNVNALAVTVSNALANLNSIEVSNRTAAITNLTGIVATVSNYLWTVDYNSSNALSAAIAGIGSVITNGGNATLNSVSASAYLNTAYTYSLTNAATVTVDLSKSSLQVINLYSVPGSVTLTATNAAAGQNVTALLRVVTGSAGAFYTDGLMLNLNSSGNSTGMNLPTGKTALITLLAVGSGQTNVLFGGQLTK